MHDWGRALFAAGLSSFVLSAESRAQTVLHVDARRPGSGETVAVEGCLASLAR